MVIRRSRRRKRILQATHESGWKERAARPIPAAARIRASARELFDRKGIRDVSVDEIVDHAGLTKPTFYRCFPSKDDLVVSYLWEISEAFWERFDLAVAEHPDDARAQLLDVLGAVEAHVRSYGFRGCGLSNVAVEFADRSHPAWEVVVEHKRRVRARLVEMAAASGASAPERLADGLAMLIEGASQIGHFLGSAGSAGSLVEVAAQLIDANAAARRGSQARAGF